MERKSFLVWFTLLFGLLAAHARTQDVTTPPTSQAPPRIQLAILLDNSGSMSGLINQARSELWKIVNEMATAERGGQRPILEVAVLHYGNPPIVIVSPLTDDLDRVSEALFSIGISGGSEHCGEVIQRAVTELKWSTEANDLKVIFIAGNEPFTQGPIDYREACKAAITKGIVINTIHCGNGIPEDWKQGALLGEGQAMNIDQNQVAQHIPSPHDAKITELGKKLNGTYVAYGVRAREAKERQAVQDVQAEGVSEGASVQRSVAKAGRLYDNASWDLVDKLKAVKGDWSQIKEEELPDELRKMPVEERKAFVTKMAAEREQLQKQINELNQAREAFVAAKRKEMAEANGEKTLDQVMIGAVREQAAKKAFGFEKK